MDVSVWEHMHRSAYKCSLMREQSRTETLWLFLSQGKWPFPEEKGGVVAHVHLGKSFPVKITINWIKINPGGGSG